MKKALFCFLCLVTCVGFSAEYKDLPFTSQDRDNIHKLVKTLATKEWYSLLKRKKELEALGKRIEETVHPLPFMACILCDNRRKQYLFDIRDYTLMKQPVKWNSFKEGLFNRLNYMHSHHNLLPYIPGFAQEIGVSSEHLMQYASSKDWNCFLKYIMQ